MAAAEPGFLRLDGLTRRFGERVAVDGLTVDIGKGEVFGFLGPNGAGKSTTFHLLSGLLAPDGGRVLIDGVLAPPTDGRVRRRLGVVFQAPSLDDKLTARENLSLGCALYGLSGRRAAARIDELLALCGYALRPLGREQTNRWAKWYFLYSIIYLPILIAALVIGRT